MVSERLMVQQSLVITKLILVWFNIGNPQTGHVGDYLDHNLLQHWISRTADDCWTLLNCPPRSTNVILWNYFIWGFIREEMFFFTQAPESGRLQERNCSSNERCWWRNRNKRLDVTRLLDWRLQGTRGSFI